MLKKTFSVFLELHRRSKCYKILMRIFFCLGIWRIDLEKIYIYVYIYIYIYIIWCVESGNTSERILPGHYDSSVVESTGGYSVVFKGLTKTLSGCSNSPVPSVIVTMCYISSRSHKRVIKSSRQFISSFHQVHVSKSFYHCSSLTRLSISRLSRYN